MNHYDIQSYGDSAEIMTERNQRNREESYHRDYVASSWKEKALAMENSAELKRKLVENARC
jgi:hypothetical protein